MNVLVEFLSATLVVGLPIGLFTLALVWWATRSGHLQDSDDSKSLKSQIKAMSKSKSDAESKPQGLVEKKWAKFGGGFYGVAAFLTYLVVEVTEALEAIANVGGLASFLGQLDIGVIINALVESLTNFITAMVWPAYWMDRIDTQMTWLWFVVAYLGYWLGIKAAHQLVVKGVGSN